jgi:hypothetical protein
MNTLSLYTVIVCGGNNRFQIPFRYTCYSVTWEQWRRGGKRNNLLYFVVTVIFDSYSWGVQFDSRPGQWFSWLRFLAVFLSFAPSKCLVTRLGQTASFQTLANSSVIVPTLCSSKYWRIVPKCSWRNWGKPWETSVRISTDIYSNRQYVRVLTPRIHRRVVRWKWTDVSEEQFYSRRISQARKPARNTFQAWHFLIGAFLLGLFLTCSPKRTLTFNGP